MESDKELELPESLKTLLNYEVPEGTMLSITDICSFDDAESKRVNAFIRHALEEHERS